MNKIKEIRRQKCIMQKDLAAMSDISQPFLHDLENGNRNAKRETWERIAAALGCTIDELFGKTKED